MTPRILMIAYACNPEGGGEHWLGWGWAAQAATFGDVHLITTPNSRAQIERHAPRHGITPHFVGVPRGWRKLSSRLGGAGSWLRKIVWQYRVLHVARSLHEKENFQIVHQTTFHTFRVPFLAARLGIPPVWGPIAGGESVPRGFARDLGPARFGEAVRGFINRLWLWCPHVRDSLRRAQVILVSNRTTLDFLPPAIREKCVVVPPNALRPEDEVGRVTPRAPQDERPATHGAHELPLSQRESAGVRENATNRRPPALHPHPSHSLKEEGAPRSTFQLLYVGNCVATRALPLVFAALQNSGLEHCRLKVIGDGPALGRWRRLASRMRLSGTVEFMGRLPREKLAAFYNQADALVFPALRDSGGSALLEAMARGIPVICLDWGGPGEMVDANSGVKIPVRDRDETIAALAAAFARLQELPELRLTLGRAGRERALAHFNWDTKKTLLAAIYERLLCPP